jgi:hypothetical protein
MQREPLVFFFTKVRGLDAVVAYNEHENVPLIRHTNKERNCAMKTINALTFSTLLFGTTLYAFEGSRPASPRALEEHPELARKPQPVQAVSPQNLEQARARAMVASSPRVREEFPALDRQTAGTEFAGHTPLHRGLASSPRVKEENEWLVRTPTERRSFEVAPVK